MRSADARSDSIPWLASAVPSTPTSNPLGSAPAACCSRSSPRSSRSPTRRHAPGSSAPSPARPLTSATVCQATLHRSGTLTRSASPAALQRRRSSGGGRLNSRTVVWPCSPQVASWYRSGALLHSLPAQQLCRDDLSDVACMVTGFIRCSPALEGPPSSRSPNCLQLSCSAWHWASVARKRFASRRAGRILMNRTAISCA